MIVVPMVFSALVLGVVELSRGHGLPGVAGRTLLFTIVLSGLSVAIGMALVNVLRPGAGVELASVLPSAGSVEALRANAEAARPLSQIIVELIPRNPIDSAVRALDGEMLALMVFALIFGVAVSATGGGRSAGDTVLIRLLEQVF